MINKLIQYLFWSKAFEGIREAHKNMCYELGRYDEEQEYCYTYIDEKYQK